jgi:hypothetical protein
MSDPVYDKLAFRGYRILVETSSGSVWRYPYRDYLDIKDMMRRQPDPHHFPSPAEACMIITNGERGKGIMCRPHSVEDLEGNILWINDK